MLRVVPHLLVAQRSAEPEPGGGPVPVDGTGRDAERPRDLGYAHSAKETHLGDLCGAGVEIREAF